MFKNFSKLDESSEKTSACTSEKFLEKKKAFCIIVY